MIKYIVGLSIAFGGLLACEGEDFAHFHSRMYSEASFHNVQIAEGYFKDHNFSEAKVFFEIAEQECGAMTFSNPMLEFRIKVGLLFAELLENPYLFSEKNVYIDRLRALMCEHQHF